MEINMDKEKYEAPLAESKMEAETDVKYSQDKEIDPDANSNLLNENDADAENPSKTANTNTKKKRKRNRWRRNKRKSATPAGGATHEDGISLSLSKVSSNETVCPIPAEPPLKCSCCSSTNLSKTREQSMNLPEIKERIEEEEVPVLVPIHDKILTESGDNSEKEDEVDNEEKVTASQQQLLKTQQLNCKDLELIETQQPEQLQKQDPPGGNADARESESQLDNSVSSSCEPSYEPSDILCNDKYEKSEPEIVKNVSNKTNEILDSAELKSESSNVAVIFRIGAAVFETPLSSVTKVVSEEQLNPITGLYSDPDFDPEAGPVLKYVIEEEDSFGELWDGQDRIHSQDDENNNYVSITPYCVNKSEEGIEEHENKKEQSVEVQKDNIPEIQITNSSISLSHDTISPSILKVPHPSIETSDGLLALPHYTPRLHTASLIRRAIAKIENPELDEVATNVVNDIIISAEEYLRNDKENKEFLQTKLVTKLDEHCFTHNRAELEHTEEEQKDSQGLSNAQTELFDLNIKKLILKEEESEEIIRCNDEWVIDPKVIEDAVSEAVLSGKSKATKRTSLVKSLRKCFGKKQGESKFIKSTTKKQKL